jgi:aminopeptidase
MLPPLVRNAFRITTRQTNARRFFSNKQGFDSLVIGAYTSESQPLLTTQQVSNETRKRIESQLALSQFKKIGDVRIFYNEGGVKQIAVVSLGDKIKKNQHEEQESVRMAVMYYRF